MSNDTHKPLRYTHTQAHTIRAASLFIRLPFLCIQSTGHNTPGDIMKTLKFCAYVVFDPPSTDSFSFRFVLLSLLLSIILSLRWLYNKSTEAINSDNISQQKEKEEEQENINTQQDHNKWFWLLTGGGNMQTKLECQQ